MPGELARAEMHEISFPSQDELLGQPRRPDLPQYTQEAGGGQNVDAPDAELIHLVFEPCHDLSGEATEVLPGVVLYAEGDGRILPEGR